jgi:HEAT repeat protein
MLDIRTMQGLSKKMKNFHKSVSLIISTGILGVLSFPCVYQKGMAYSYAKTIKRAGVISGTADKPTAKTKEKEPPETNETRIHWLEETLDYGIQEERIKAMDKMAGIKDERARDRLAKKLIALMKDETDPEVLVKALSVLSEMKERSAIPLMTEKIDDPSEEVRTEAVYGLKRLDAVSSKNKLIEKLKQQNLNNNSNFTNALIDALAQLKAVELVPFIKDALAKGSTAPGIREGMVLFLGKIGAKEAKDILLKLYADEEEDANLRSYAVNSLGNSRIVEAAPEIKKVVRSIESYEFRKRRKYYTLYIYSITALAKMGDADAVPKLVQALRSNNSGTRIKVINLIKDFKDQRTIDILKYKMKNDQDPKVRAAAKKALEELGVENSDGRK